MTEEIAIRVINSSRIDSIDAVPSIVALTLDATTYHYGI